MGNKSLDKAVRSDDLPTNDDGDPRRSALEDFQSPPKKPKREGVKLPRSTSVSKLDCSKDRKMVGSMSASNPGKKGVSLATKGVVKHRSSVHSRATLEDVHSFKSSSSSSFNPSRSNSVSETEMADEVDQSLPSKKRKKVKVSVDDFQTICVIGRGSFGKVLQVQHKTNGKVFAMKVMRKDNIIAKDQVAHTRGEKTILQKIKHPFIVNLHYAFQTDEKLYLVMDYVNGGELFFHLKKYSRFPEVLTKFYAAEIACALLHLHNNRIIYRDLKPENLLLASDGHIVITDFGLSKEMGPTDTTKTRCGSKEYLAPEVLKGQPYSFPVDWWSLGTLLFEMMAGTPPFFSEDPNEMYRGILTENLSYFPHDISDDACDFLTKLLDKNPKTRLGGNAVLNHHWFAGMDWAKLEAKQVIPPWRPNVKSSVETTQIDDIFLAMNPLDSPAGDQSANGENEKNVPPADLFAGFTYNGASSNRSQENEDDMNQESPKDKSEGEVKREVVVDARDNRTRNLNINLSTVVNSEIEFQQQQQQQYNHYPAYQQTQYPNQQFQQPLPNQQAQQLQQQQLQQPPLLPRGNPKAQYHGGYGYQYPTYQHQPPHSQQIPLQYQYPQQYQQQFHPQQYQQQFQQQQYQQQLQQQQQFQYQPQFPHQYPYPHISINTTITTAQVGEDCLFEDDTTMSLQMDTEPSLSSSSSSSSSSSASLLSFGNNNAYYTNNNKQSKGYPGTTASLHHNTPVRSSPSNTFTSVQHMNLPHIAQNTDIN